METEEGTSNADNAEQAELNQCLNSGAVNNGVTINGGNDVAEGSILMETEEGAGNADKAEQAELNQCLNSAGVNNGVTINGGNDVAEGSIFMETKEGTSNADKAEQVELNQCLNSGAVNNGVTINGGNDIAEGSILMETEEGTSDADKAEQVELNQCLNSGAVNNGVTINGGNYIAEGSILMETEEGTSNADKAEQAELNQCLNSGAVNNGVTINVGNDVAEGGEVLILKNEAMDKGVAIADENGVAEGVVWGSKNEAVNNGMTIAVDGNGVAEGEEVRCLKNGNANNGAAIADGFGVTEGDSSGIECFRTYKRRKRVKSSSESKVQEDSRVCVKAASRLSDQAVKKPCDLAVGNTSKDYSHGHWGNIVLQHLYHSLGNNNGGVERSIREALMNHPKISYATTVMETFKIDQDGQECSSQFEWLSHRLQNEANGHANVMHNGFSSESDGHGATERCQHVFCNILASEKFSSLCKVLLENFQGMKPESVFDFSAINSRMKKQAYEQSPALFLSDIQQVWRKLQDTGNEIVAIAQSLSNLSEASYYEQFCNQESNSHMKPEQTEEYATYKICTCRHCGDKANETECLVCDSCEEMYHVSCIEPAVKEIPHKSWFCANCIASGVGSRHENCVVCERLNVPKTLNNIVGEESIPTNEETLNELEENLNCTDDDGIQVSIGGRNSSDCKICRQEVNGEKIKICGHSFCPSKYYHVRCLSSRQIKSFGRCWYCPSCLCQVCFTDKDDDKIVLCDGCDHAYHIYCVKPPQNSIPRGKWFCRNCDAGIQAICLAKKAYESNKWRAGKNVSKLNDNIDKKWSNKGGRELDKVGGMDMLLTAANTLNFEENFAAIQTDSRRT